MQTGYTRLKGIDRATDTMPSLIENMGINHRRTDILVAKQLLYCPNIVPIFQQMSGKGMAKSTTPDPFDDVRLEDSFVNNTLKKGLMDVISAVNF